MHWKHKPSMPASLSVSWSSSSPSSRNWGGVPVTIAQYSSVVVLLLLLVVGSSCAASPRTGSSLCCRCSHIGAPSRAAHHIEEVGGLINREPPLVQFLDLVAIGWGEGALAIRLLPPPTRLLLLLLVPTFLPIFIQGMATRSPTTCGLIARQPGYCHSTTTWVATTRIAMTRTRMTPGMANATMVGRAEDGDDTNSGGTPPPPNDDIVIS